MTSLERIMEHMNRPEQMRAVTDVILESILPGFAQLGPKDKVRAAAQEIADLLTSHTAQISRQVYQEAFTEDQLKAMADFYDTNPWFISMSSAVAIRCNALVQDRVKEPTMEILERYFGKEEKPLESKLLERLSEA